jgi:hypothetical protein
MVVVVALSICARRLCCVGSILLFDPRREHSSVPTARSRSRRAQGLSRLAASSRPPEGLGLDSPEHGGMLDGLGRGGSRLFLFAGAPAQAVALEFDAMGVGRGTLQRLAFAGEFQCQ